MRNNYDDNVVKSSLIMKNNITENEERYIEINGYKPLTLIPHMSKNIKRCLNENNPSCPHRIFNEKKKEEQSEMLKNEKQPDNIIPKKNNSVLSENKSKCNDTKHKEKNNNLATKTLDKWKLYTIKQQNLKLKKYEESLRIKRRKYLLKKYWSKWFDNYKNRKREKEELIKRKNRIEKLNQFFDKLQEVKDDLKKTKDSSFMSNYETMKGQMNNEESNINKQSNHKFNDKATIFVNRLKAQKNIIMEQKMKLEEQNKLIKKLKEEKLINDVKELNKNLHSNVCEMIKTCDKKLKPSAKVLANQLNIYNESMDKLIKEDNFVIRMNERAQMRREKWEMIRLRKQMIEDEKRQKEIEEEERRLEEEEKQRKMKLKEKRDKIKMQKIIEIKKMKEIEETKIKMEKAKDHYNRNLKVKIINILRSNLLQRENKEAKATAYYNKMLMRNTFNQWKEESQYSIRRKIITADIFYQFNLVYKCWTNWIMVSKPIFFFYSSLILFLRR